MRQRTWTAEEELAIVMEGIKGSRSVADMCREHRISQTLYYRRSVAGHVSGGGQEGSHKWRLG